MLKRYGAFSVASISCNPQTSHKFRSLKIVTYVLFERGIYAQIFTSAPYETWGFGWITLVSSFSRIRSSRRGTHHVTPNIWPRNQDEIVENHRFRPSARTSTTFYSTIFPELEIRFSTPALTSLDSRLGSRTSKTKQAQSRLSRSNLTIF